VAAGRRPRVAGLGLDLARVAHSDKGITVDRRCARRTSTSSPWATCWAARNSPILPHYHAGIVIRNAPLPLPAKVNLSALPWVTFTDPELAHVGLSEAAARATGDIRILRWPLSENDRAQAEHRHEGFIKIVTSARAASWAPISLDPRPAR